MLTDLPMLFVNYGTCTADCLGKYRFVLLALIAPDGGGMVSTWICMS